MIIQLKLLRGEQAPLEVDNSWTIEQIKHHIQEKQGHPIDTQKLLFKGKILDNSKTVLDYQITENSIIVLMVSKPKSSELPPPVVQPDRSDAASTRPVQSQPRPAVPEPTEEAISSILSMGFTREDTIAALRSARNNPEVAVEFLMAGYIPENLEEPEESQMSDSHTFDFLLESPEFQSIREVILQNPSELNNFMTQIQQTNPDLFSLISQNLNEFVQVLRGSRTAPSGPAIQLTTQEEADVRDLISLGFSSGDALQAYLSCNRSKEMAANLLFENFEPNQGGES